MFKLTASATAPWPETVLYSFTDLDGSFTYAGLRRDRGGRAEARNLLAPVYCRFTEGFDAPDLKDAKALLDEVV